MPAKVLIRPPANRASNGAQTINRELGNVSRLSRISPVPRQYRCLINWGNTDPVVAARAPFRVLNQPSAVALAVDKLVSLRALQQAGVRVPEFTTTLADDRGRDVWLARTNLRGSGGDGIVVVRRGEPVPAAPLYVKYVPKLEEYRVHVVDGHIVFIQQKRRVRDNEQTDDEKLIRNHANGWVFCPVTDGRACGQDLAINAVAALGLDFGAVDLIIGRDDRLAYILEVNTAPGIESPTLAAAYKEEFRRALGADAIEDPPRLRRPLRRR